PNTTDSVARIQLQVNGFLSSTDNLDFRPIFLCSLLDRRSFRFSDKDSVFPIQFVDRSGRLKPIPSGDLVPPPQLTRNTPRLDILHPIEIGFLPVLRDERSTALTNR